MATISLSQVFLGTLEGWGPLQCLFVGATDVKRKRAFCIKSVLLYSPSNAPTNTTTNQSNSRILLERRLDDGPFFTCPLIFVATHKKIMIASICGVVDVISWTRENLSTLICPLL
jgi:hypothetical protein